jgi:hypothetical protein
MNDTHMIGAVKKEVPQSVGQHHELFEGEMFVGPGR